MKTRHLLSDPTDPSSLEYESKENIYREEQESPGCGDVGSIGRIRSGNCSGKSISQPSRIPLTVGEQLARILELTSAERDRLACLLRDVLVQFRRELTASYTTAQQQHTLREARAALAEIGVTT